MTGVTVIMAFHHQFSAEAISGKLKLRRMLRLS